MKKILTSLLMASAWAFAAQAVDYNGVEVTFSGGTPKTVGDDLVITFDESDSLAISGGAVKANILVVGGGGGGGGAKRQNSGTRNRYGAGGAGGSVRLFEGQLLDAGVPYAVKVGQGGTAGSGRAQTAGGDGEPSSFGDLEEQLGGKGGSANVTSATSGKGASGSGTAGVASSISGESVEYGKGGTSGGGEGTAEWGNGGGGAAQTSSGTTTENGAAGGSGVVIVRLTKAVPGKLVDNLAITETIVAGTGGTFTPIASVPEGVTLTGETSASDIGHYQFVASLKPGYVWRDGLVTTPRIYSWSVVEKAEDAANWINVTKAVHTDPDNPSNAWIAVRGMLPEQQYVPNVLFLGTECNAHSLTAKNLQDAIEAIASVANIDWHIFKSTTASGDSDKDKDRSGAMLKGDTFASKGYANLVLDNNNHHAARRFYETLDAVRLDAVRSNKYDFIILEFDGSRLADQYTQRSETDKAGSLGPYVNEAKVAEFLRPYYAAERVFWMVDNHAANYKKDSGDYIGQVEPWDDGYYRPNTYFHNNYNNTLTDAEYKGLIGLLDPERYDPDATTAAQLAETSREWQPTLCKCTINKRSCEWYDKGTGGNGKRTIYANRRYSRQVFYDDGDALNEYLLDFINAKYRLLFLDKIVEDLEVVSAKFYRSFAEDGRTMWDDSDGWVLVAEQAAGSDPVYHDTSGNASISIAGQEVSSSMSNLNSAVWGKMEIYVRDSGSFKDGVVPEYDEASGKWIGKKNPNSGLAMVTRYDKMGAVEASGEAPVGIFWEYPAYTIKGSVTNGTLWIDGVETNETHKIEGSDAVVTYRGDPGYAIDHISVDGAPLTADEISEHISDYGFTNIKADHEVVVVYTNFVVTSRPYSNYYDGAEHTITVTPPKTYGDITDVKVLYSANGGGTYSDTPPAYSNAGHAVVHYKVVGHQAGYGDEEITLATGSDTVDILPREVNVTADSARKFYDGKELTAGYEVQHDYADDLRESGWGFVGTDDITTVKMTDGSVVGADAAKTEKKTAQNVIDQSKTRFTSDEIAGNYIVHYTDGELEVIPVAVKPVVRIYDGIPTNVEVTVTEPPAGTAIRYSYDKDGAYVEAGDLTFTGPTNVLESAEIWVEVSAPGYGAVTNSADVTILRRYVVEQAGSAEKPFDNTPLTQAAHAEKPAEELKDALAAYEDLYGEDLASSATGFVGADGFASVPMTAGSTITDPGVVSNTIDAAAVAFTPSYNPGNYSVRYLQGELRVTAGTFGASASPALKVYDGEPTNIAVTVTGVPDGVTPTYEYSYSATEGFVPASEFTGPTNVSESATVYCKVTVPGCGEKTVSADVTILRRYVVEQAGSASKPFDNTPLTQAAHAEKPAEELKDALAAYEDLYGEDLASSATGFVGADGFASVPMTAGSTITDPGVVSNTIDAAAVAFTPSYDPGNYSVRYLQGELRVTPAAFTASATPYDEFYDGQEHTIEVEVRKPEEAGEATVSYSYEEGGTYLPIEDFEQLKDVTAGGPVTVYAKVEVEGYSAVVVSATVNIKPRIVVEQAESASKIFDGTPLVQPNHHEETDVEAEKSKEKWGTDEVLANSTGFVAGEGFASVPMTAGSTITEPGVEDNVIDAAAVTLLEGTKPGNYIFYYLPGALTVIQRQEEVRRDPEVEIPEEAKEVVEKSDKKINEALDELVKNDPKAGEEPYIKYQLTVTPTNHLDGTTRTTPEKAAEDAKEQIELAESETGSKIDKVEFVDIVLERTYDKTEAEETAKGNYNKDNWESIDKAEEHGNKLFEVVIPVVVPEGMELAGVTRSCDNRGTEILRPKDPSDPNAEGFIYDPETKTVTLYARDFCVFGFLMKASEGCPTITCAYVYRVKLAGKTVKGRQLAGKTSCDATTCWAKPASFRVAGYIYGSGDETGSACDPCSCNEWTLGGARCHYWDENRKQVFEDVTTFGFDLIEVLRNNGGRNKVQVFWTLDGLKLAGFGVFNPATRKLKSASGFFAGALKAPTCSNWNAATCSEGEPTPALVFTLCALTETMPQCAVTYGRWSMTYKSDKASQAEEEGVWSCLYPSGWQPAAAE